MSAFRQNPAYNLKVVLKETGIKADVLRAWERRYGLPMPQRTEGGHRLYSQRDIETIKWLVARQGEGLSISRAVELWRELESTSNDPLAESRQIDVSTPPVFPVSHSSLESLRAEWVNACLAFNETAAEQALNQAFGLYSVEVVCTELLQRGLSDIGELWYRNQASVQQEHFASGLAMRRLDALLSAAPAPVRSETILAACPADEWHVFSLLVFSLFLRRRGWNVTYLGANVPLDRMSEAVDAIRPNLVILAAQQLNSAVSLQEMALILHKKSVQSAYGGRIFNRIPEIRAYIPGHFLGTSIEVAVQSVEMLIMNPVKPHYEPVPEKYLSMLAEYRQKRASIENFVIETIHPEHEIKSYLGIANFHFGNALASVLSLGNPLYIAADMEWLRILLDQHQIPVSLLPHYLTLYAQSVQKMMGEKGLLLVEYINLYKTQTSQGFTTHAEPLS
jgi:DNA-binding transcriptional MerR regulator